MNDRSLARAKEAPPKASRGYAYFLDLDGTLVELAATPDTVVVPAPLIAALEALARDTKGAVAVISGRALERVDALLAPLNLPIASEHGHKRRDARGTIHGAEMPAHVLSAIKAELSALAENELGLLVEAKGASLALHYRARPELGTALKAKLTALAKRFAEDVALLEGKYVLELKPKEASKGRAIAAFLDEPPFAGRKPVFVGDDVTDEDGFRVVNAAQGITIRVAHGSDGAQATEARYRLESPAALLDWLAARA
jgi:trehalose 6-phosphate phosphatase